MALQIPKAFVEEIGRVAILQSHIEGGLAAAITSLADVDDATGDVIARPLRFPTLHQIASDLLALRSPRLNQSIAGRMRAILVRTRNVEQHRNQLIHSMWTYGPSFDGTTASRVKLVGKPATLKASTVTLAELREIRNEMEELSAELTYIHPKLRVPEAATNLMDQVKTS